MGCDCKKTYSIGMGCCQPVLAPADNFYTKYQTDMRIEEAISGITVSGITEEQAEEMIEEATSGKANSSDVYTKQETDTLLDNKLDASAYTPTDLSNYYTKDESDNKYQQKGDYVTGEQMSAFTYDKATIDEMVESGGTESKAIVAGRGIKVTTGDTADTVAFDLPIYTARTLTPREWPYTYLKTTDGLLVSTSENDKFYQGYERKFAVGQGWSGQTAYDFLVDYDGKIYIDDYKDVTQYGNRNTYCLQDKLDSLQPILTAGTGIDITNNVISVTGGGESSGVTSGEVQTMIDQSISGKADNADLVTVSGDVIALSGAVIDNEEVVARALNDLNDKKTSSGDVVDIISAYTYDKNEIDNKIASGGGITSGDVVDIVSGYTYSKDEVDTKILDSEGRMLDAIDAAVSADTEDIKQDVAQLQLSAVTDAQYDSTAKTINFYNITGGSIASIDATEFIKDGMIEDVEIVTSGGTTYLRITFNTDAGHEEIDLDLSSIFDVNNYYTKSEVYNKTEVDNKFWCGSEADWSQISGSTQSGTLYLIY